MNVTRIQTGLLVLLSTLSSLAAASECVPSVKDGWVRLPPGDMPMMAGFGRIENGCKAPVTIVGVKSAAFGDVSLHETRIVDSKDASVLYCDGNVVMVWIDRTSGRAAQLPEAVRAACS